MLSYLQGTLVGGGQRQGQVHKGLEGAGLPVAGETLNCALKLTLEQRYDDRLVEQLVFGPGLVSSPLVVQIVILLLYVTLTVSSLQRETEDRSLQHGQRQRTGQYNMDRHHPHTISSPLSPHHLLSSHHLLNTTLGNVHTIFLVNDFSPVRSPVSLPC